MNPGIAGRVPRYLDEDSLAWVIADAFTHKKLAKYMSREEIEYIGTRITSIPHEDLACDLARRPLNMMY